MNEHRPNAEPSPEELLGAYAVDAVDPDEQLLVEAYLADHPDARAELARFEDVLAALADTHVAEPPEELWSKVQQQLRPPATLRRLSAEADAGASPDAAGPVGHDGYDRDRPEVAGVAIGPSLRLVPDPPSPTTGPGQPTPAPAPAPRRPAAARASRLWRPALIAAAAAIAAIAVSVTVLDGGDGPTTLRELALAADAAPGARAAVLEGTAGTARLVLDDDGNAYLLADELERLDGEQTYQLWSLDGDTPVSLGVIGAEPTVVAVPKPDGRTFALSVEARGGSAAPTLPPVAAGELSA